MKNCLSNFLFLIFKCPSPMFAQKIFLKIEKNIYGLRAPLPVACTDKLIKGNILFEWPLFLEPSFLLNPSANLTSKGSSVNKASVIVSIIMQPLYQLPSQSWLVYSHPSISATLVVMVSVPIQPYLEININHPLNFLGWKKLTKNFKIYFHCQIADNQNTKLRYYKKLVRFFIRSLAFARDDGVLTESDEKHSQQNSSLKLTNQKPHNYHFPVIIMRRSEIIGNESLKKYANLIGWFRDLISRGKFKFRNHECP